MKTENKAEAHGMTVATVAQMLTSPVMHQLVDIVVRKQLDDMARQSALSGSILVWEFNQAQVAEIAKACVCDVADELGANGGDVQATIAAIHNRLGLINGIQQDSIGKPEGSA